LTVELPYFSHQSVKRGEIYRLRDVAWTAPAASPLPGGKSQ